MNHFDFTLELPKAAPRGTYYSRKELARQYSFTAFPANTAPLCIPVHSFVRGNGQQGCH
jgi:hypothetical protein